MSVHRSARGYDVAADVYERVRPGYTAAAMAWLAELLDLRSGRTVLDLAAGTGKLTSRLVTTGARVIAVEQSDGMLAVLRERVPDAEVLAGTAQEIPLEDSSVDAVTVAQAFHWFANDAALAEIHRVLRPGGALALVWNRRDLTDPAHAVLEAALAPWKGDTPRHRDVGWERVLDASPLFEPLASEEVPNDHELPPGGLEERAVSTSFIAALPEATRHDALAEVRAFEARAPGPIVLPHVTELFAFRALHS
jgi:SAM-dependent methyltransferase